MDKDTALRMPFRILRHSNQAVDLRKQFFNSSESPQPFEPHARTPRSQQELFQLSPDSLGREIAEIYRSAKFDGVRLDKLERGTVREVSPSVGSWLITQGYADAEMRQGSNEKNQDLARFRSVRDRDTAALWVQLAQWLARANEPVKAVEAAQKAISLEPTNAAPHLTLADIFRRQGMRIA